MQIVMNKPASLLVAVNIFIVCLTLVACGEKTSPEGQIKAYIAKSVAAVEAREILAVRELISEQYKDEHRRDRNHLAQLAAGYFFRHKNIHLFTQINDITFPAPDKSNVKLYVAMAGRPIKGAQALIDIRANLYQFDFTLTKQSGEWLLEKIRWQQASIEDIVGG